MNDIVILSIIIFTFAFTFISGHERAGWRASLFWRAYEAYDSYDIPLGHANILFNE